MTTPVPRRLAALALSLALPAPVLAQGEGDATAHQPNAWLVYNGQHRVSSRLGLHLEAQLRRTEWLARPKQVLLRSGLRWTWREGATVAAGYAWQRTSPHGILAARIGVPEHRAWEQLELGNTAGRLELSQRLRVEHRWEATVVDADDAPRLDGWTFSHRARLQLGATLPLHAGSTRDEPGWYVAATAEPFVRFGPNTEGRAFDQQRTSIALGHGWGERLRVQAAYLHQYDVPTSGRARETSHVLQVTVASSAPLGGAR